MSKPTSIENRRQFLKFAVIGAVAAPLAARMIAQPAFAADLPPLDPNNSTAKALGYVEDHTKADVKKHPNYKPDQNCLNCKFYGGGAARGTCTLF
ncbi:MAG: high-potential iron-sulfur protein, partial [Dokdonella sp.]